MNSPAEASSQSAQPAESATEARAALEPAARKPEMRALSRCQTQPDKKK